MIKFIRTEKEKNIAIVDKVIEECNKKGSA